MADGRLKDGIIEYAGAYTPGWISNLSIIGPTAGVVTIADAQGAAVTSTNPGWVTVPSTTAGQLVTLKVNTALSFTDDSGSSDLAGLGFGITETVHWASDMPFWLYTVNRANSNIDGADGSSTFFLSRDPRMYTTPSAANDIGDTGTIPVNDSQNVILLMQSATVANYTSLPCQLIGAVRMQWSTTTDDWTVQTLGNSDGLGPTQLDKTFSTPWTMPLAQNGAATGTHLFDNGGTAPIFSTNDYTYTVNKDGTCHVYVHITGDGGSDGATGVNAILSLPYQQKRAYIQTLSSGYADSSVTGGQLVTYQTTGTVTEARCFIVNAANTKMQNSDFGNGSRSLFCSGRYEAF